MKKDKQPKPEKKKRRSLREIFNASFKGLKWKDVKGIGKETLKDLKQPREIFAMVAGVVVPGCFFPYAIYRVVKYREGQDPANDDTEQKKPKPPESKPPAP